MWPWGEWADALCMTWIMREVIKIAETCWNYRCSSVIVCTQLVCGAKKSSVPAWPEPDTLELLIGLVTIESLHLPHREQRVRYVPIWDKGVCTRDTSAWYFNATLHPDDWGPPTAGQNRPSRGLSEASLKAYENMNEFLSAFIERVSHLNVCSLADHHTLDSSYCPSILWTGNMRLLKAVHLAAFGGSMHPCKLQALWSQKPRRIKKHCIFSHCSIPILAVTAISLLPLQSIRELDYMVKDRLFLEKVLGMEFYDAMDRSLFYNGKKLPSSPS